ncbi:MAG: trimethylamine methyltransferase, partial [Mesorhizobium sp.]
YVKRRINVYEVLDEEGLALIEKNTDTVLEEIGIIFRDDAEALQLWKEAGADVKGERVHFPKGLCRSLLKTAPSVYTQHARNAERSVQIGGNATVFAPVYGPPFVRDLDGVRRYATIEDFRNFVKLAYMAPSIHHSGGTVCEPVDVPVNKRHLDMVYSHIKYSDKPFMGSVTAPERAEDTVAMAKIVFGDDFVENNTVLTSLINANSPMVFDETMLGALKVYSRHNQACIVTPFILAGAMSPVTVAGTLTQVLAEVLAGASFTQLIRTGGSLCASKIPDAQAAYESANTLNSTILAGTNFVLHSAGWLEGGLASCYEKFMMDIDQLGMTQKLSEGVDLSENGQAMDAIRQVGPGSHYLGCNHTQANFQTAFYRSNIADNNSYEQWLAEGEKTAPQRANELARRWLESYEAPHLDQGIDDGLKEFIARKKASMADAFT